MVNMITTDKSLTAFFGGVCEWWEGRRNPGGIATYGWLIYEDGIWIARGYGEVGRGGRATKSTAEYAALISLLMAYTDLGFTAPMCVFGDSRLAIQLFIRQLCRYRVEFCNLKPLYEPDVELTWIPREENTVTNELSRRAYTMARLKVVCDNGVDPWEVRAKNKEVVRWNCM